VKFLRLLAELAETAKRAIPIAHNFVFPSLSLPSFSPCSARRKTASKLKRARRVARAMVIIMELRNYKYQTRVGRTARKYNVRVRSPARGQANPRFRNNRQFRSKRRNNGSLGAGALLRPGVTGGHLPPPGLSLINDFRRTRRRRGFPRPASMIST